MKKNNTDMLSGSITKGLLSMTIPIMIMNVAQSLFNIADTAILKAFGYETAVGAVGVCSSLIVLCTSLLIGISAGANVVIARRIGAAKNNIANKAAITAILLAVITGILLMVIGAVFAESFLKMINCPKTLLHDATSYFRIYFYSIPSLLLYNFCASILRATGDTRRPMYFLIIGCITKIIFTVIFLKTFRKAVESVAIASILSNTVACILSFVTLAGRNDIIKLDFRHICFDITELKAILYNGIPAGLQSALYSFANVIITTAVNSFGAAATTGISIANQYDGILYQISYAPSLATIPYIAQNMGAGNIKRVKKTILRSVLITIVFGASLGSLSAIFSRELSYLMTSSAEVVKYSQQKMMLISSTYFICGINEVLGGTLKGMGKPIPPVITSLIYMCVLRFVWVYAIFPLIPNLTFLYTVWPVGWTLSIITLLIVYSVKISKIKQQ